MKAAWEKIGWVFQVGGASYLMSLVLTMSLLGTNCALATEGTPKTRPKTIPENLQLYLRAHFPDLSILPRERALEEILRYFAAATIHQPSPFACSGDFNGDGLEDFALLLSDRTKGTLELIAFHQTPKQDYVHFVIEHLHDVRDAAGREIEYITCHKPGKIRSSEGPVLDLRNYGIVLAYWEQAAELYYFQGNRYVVFGLSD